MQLLIREGVFSSLAFSSGGEDFREIKEGIERLAQL